MFGKKNKTSNLPLGISKEYLDAIILCLDEIRIRLYEQLSNGWGEHWALFQINTFLPKYIDLIDMQFQGVLFENEKYKETKNIQEFAKIIFDKMMSEDESIEVYKNGQLVHMIADEILTIVTENLNNEEVPNPIEISTYLYLIKYAIDYIQNNA